MKIPEGAREVIGALERAGYEAYLVGGCVRDMLLADGAGDGAGDGAPAVHDWDVCTNARPTEVKRVLAPHRTLDTGLKHGTVTVLMPDGPYEVTTYRVDGGYSDGRHPDSVTFTASLTEDLARRDFTINAMAMAPGAQGAPPELIDPFGGRDDLRRRVLRCVGEPDTRFGEDALRILRAIRFASRFGLTVEEKTRDAMLRNRALLGRISAERVFSELSGILVTERGGRYLHDYADILTQIIPELAPCIGFEQRNPWHCCDVFDHIMMSVASAPPELTVRLAMLLHDIGKPAAASVDETGTGHFYGHQKLSAEIAQTVLRRLRCPNRLLRDIVELVRCHDARVEPTERALRRLLNRLGTEQARRLLTVKRADAMAQSERARGGLGELARSEALLERIIAERQAFSLKDLAIGGNDLIACGIAPGPEIGRRLRLALDAVLDGRVENEREALLAVACAGDEA